MRTPRRLRDIEHGWGPCFGKIETSILRSEDRGLLLGKRSGLTITF
jgi:hypothetical protein